MILVCVYTWKLHAEDDPAVESQAAVLCGNARRHLALSISLLTLRPRPLQLSSPARCSFTLLPNLRRTILFLFCFSFSLCLFDPPRMPLFRFCSAVFFVLANARARASLHLQLHHICQIVVRKKFYVRSVCNKENIIWEKYSLFFILKISIFLDFNIKYLFLSVNKKKYMLKSWKYVCI